MIAKPYLIFRRGLIEERGFSLENRLTIGRTKESDIYLADRYVSRQHAVVFWRDQQAFVEDLGSRNGTFVNGRRVKVSPLYSGDTLRVGTAVFQFIQEEPLQERGLLVDTEEMRQRELSLSFDVKDLFLRSRRLRDAVSRVPLFSRLSEDDIARICQAAQLVVVDQGREIIKQGDRGKAIYIILDGKVRVFTYDNQGKEVPLACLMDNEFFGEMSFFTGAPWDSTVQAVEDSIVCMLSFEAIREIVDRSPTMEGLLEKHRGERSKGFQVRRRAARIVERRKYPRINERLPVTFLFPPSSSVYGEFKGMFFETISSDISLSGIRIKIQDSPLLGLPLGCELHLRINLTRSRGFLQCMGRLKSVVRGRGMHDLGYLGIEFPGLPQDLQRKLERFLLN